MDTFTTKSMYHTLTIDGRITDADTRIAREVVDNCERLARMLKNGMRRWRQWDGWRRHDDGLDQMIGRGLIRPVCEAVYMTVLMVRVRLPPIALASIWVYGTIGLLLLKQFAPDFSKFTKETERTMGQLRGAGYCIG